MKKRVYFSLVKFISRFEATRELFWDGPRKYEPWSNKENDTGANTPLSKLPRHTSGRTFAPVGINLHQVGLLGSSPVESSCEPGTLRLQCRGLIKRNKGITLKVLLVRLWSRFTIQNYCVHPK
ncbi:hypothetical protein AVEN_261527-1 [Araneus ventricosus]|uniref:Uncharacterized protein n=1 Tax=Araneus ventricosus TaxID=182803 RepID=A0A4Y2L3N2_ARAVE|nr:hypothetical protein AVEN_261527-1 [Araneus ventricosus]